MADVAELLVRIDATTETLRRELARADQAVTDSASRVEAATARTSRAFQQSGAAVQGSSRAMAVGLQQAGFQVGDFFVQIASGTSPVRALTQQGSQLLGVFGVWGAVAGAAVAVAGALAEKFLDLSSATERAAEAQKIFAEGMKGSNDLLEKQEDRVKRVANEQRLAALGNLQTAAAQQAVIAADIEKQLSAAEARLKKLESSGAAGGRGITSRAVEQAIAAERKRVEDLTNSLQTARASMQAADRQGEGLFGNLVPPEEIQKLEDMERDLQLNIDTLGKSNAATLAEKLARDAARKGITDETAAVRGHIVALQAELDQRKLLRDFAEDEAKERQKDSEDETQRFVDRVGAQGKLAESANEEVRNNEKLNAALKIGSRAYEEQQAIIEEIAKARAQGLNSDEDVTAATERAKALVASRRELDATKQTFQEIGDFGEKVFDDIGTAAAAMALEGQDAFKDLANVGSAVAKELELEFIKLAAINPIKNALFGQNNPTLGSVGGLLGNLINGAVGGVTGTNGGTFGGVGNGPEFRAAGGDVSASTPYLVGEKGPELFIPHTSGSIVSNDNLGRMGGGPVFNIDARGASVEAVVRLEKMVRVLNGSIEGRAISAYRDAKRRGMVPA